MKKLPITLLVLSTLLLATSCGKTESDRNVTVMLTDGDGFNITSENPVKIKSGEDAVFDVEFEKNYAFADNMPKNVKYKNGKLTVSDVKYPTTVDLYAVDKSTNRKYSFSLQSLSGGGYTESSLPGGKYPKGTRISVSATPKKDYEFLGWSLGKTIANEGELISTDRAYSFILSESTTIHANFRNTAPKVEEHTSRPVAVLSESKIILYHPNGGAIVGSEDKFYTAQSSDSYFLMPNTLPGANELFVREGYKLIGFSDKEDGSGNFYGLGHTARFADGERAVTSFYCVWEKYSDLSYFTYEDYEDGIAVTGYSGNEEKVVIPEIINGKKVTRINSGAISGDNIKTLMLPCYLTSGESGAIYDCPALEKVHMSDAITDVPNDMFSDSASFRTIHVDAAIRPVFTSNYRNFSLKYQYLISLPDDRNKVVVLSGSNTDHGLDTLLMEESLEGKYYCVNFGTDAAFNITLILDCIGSLLSDGDYMIHNFEQMDYCRGTFEINALTFQGLESNYNILSLVDFSKYTNFFESLCAFNETRGKNFGGDYNSNPSVHNKRGEKNSIQQNYNTDDFFVGSNGRFEFSDKLISKEEAANLCLIYDNIREKGATVLVSYPSFNYNAVMEEYRNKASYDTYDKFLRENLNAPVISVVHDYIFPGKYMSNTDYHLNFHGRKIRTAKLLRDFCKYTKDKYTPIDISDEDLSFWEDNK